MLQHVGLSILTSPKLIVKILWEMFAPPAALPGPTPAQGHLNGRASAPNFRLLKSSHDFRKNRFFSGRPR